MNRMLTTAAVLGLAATLPAMAGEDDAEMTFLTIGDKAPEFEISHWVKGKPVDSFEDGKVYVMEFWATWCGPCIASMPHLAEMQKKYKDYDVTIIGVSDEPLPTVVGFLARENKTTEKSHWEGIGHTLTTDPDNSTHQAYFRAAGRSGIPCSFIIGKDGKIEWIGHPMSMDEVLGEVVRDEWDRDAFFAKYEEEQKPARERMIPMMRMQRAMDNEDWDTALALIDERLAAAPDDVNLQMQKFTMLVNYMDKPREGYELMNSMMEAGWEDPMLLNMVAWTVATDKGLKTRDIDLALKAARRANELTGEKDPAILDTVARVYFENDDLAAAVEWQRMAVAALAEQDGPMAEDLRESLEKYEKMLEADTE